MARPNLSRSLPGTCRASSTGSSTAVSPSSRIREEKDIGAAICFISILKMRCVGSESESDLQELQYSHVHPKTMRPKSHSGVDCHLPLRCPKQSPQPASCRRTPSFITHP